MTWDEWLHKVLKDISEEQICSTDIMIKLWRRIREKLFWFR